MATKFVLTAAIAVSILALPACTKDAAAPAARPSEPAVEQAVEAPVPAAANPIAAALLDPARPEEERTRDSSRKPLETLQFAGLEVGMTVLEMEAGTGYFTEIMARAVGPTGTVVMQNPQSFDGFLGDALDQRLGGDRLPNVVVSRAPFDALDVADASVDLVTWIQGPHELWFTINGESLGDPSTSFAEIARVLKPGGVLLVVDHQAEAGSPPELGGTLHRIHDSHIVALASGAGLTEAARSDMLLNPEDPLSTNVFDAAIRGRSSQYVILFRK